MLALHGVGVLVTRPELQAEPLCRLLQAAGATTLRLPAIDIGPAPDLPQLRERHRTALPFDVVIFTSANAVRFGVALLDGANAAALVAAIGPATARALEAAGHGVGVRPADGFDSESLLRHPLLAAPAGRRILLVKGVGGRDLLKSTLEQRGASVTAADVYRRDPSRSSPAAVAALALRLGAGEAQVVTATSVEIADGLLRMATPALLEELQRLHWLVPGTRVAQALRERGVRAPLVAAHSAEDQDLVDALVRWRASASGA